MYQEAANYNPNANTDDGYCKYSGCTDTDATNYNPKATNDDGSCEYVTPVEPHQKKNIVIEAFTGGGYRWCPYGHVIMKEFANNIPGRVIPQCTRGWFCHTRRWLY